VVFHRYHDLPKLVTEGISVRASITTARTRIHIDLRACFRTTGSHSNVAPSRGGPVIASCITIGITNPITIAIAIAITTAVAIAVTDANTVAAAKHQD
jgi:hypothetical protein